MTGSCSNSESVDISVAEFSSTIGDDDSESLWIWKNVRSIENFVNHIEFKCSECEQHIFLVAVSQRYNVNPEKFRIPGFQWEWLYIGK